MSFKNLRNWKSKLDKNESVCGLLMDLSNVFDIIYHDLLVAKLIFKRHTDSAVQLS